MIDHLKVFDEYTVPVSGAYAAGANVLPQIREAITEAFPAVDWQWQEPYIAAVEMRGASAFTVRLNSLTDLTAKEENWEYVVRGEGTIAYIIFEGATTLTHFNTAWGPDRKNHYVVTITGVAGSTITIENGKGESIATTGTAGEYELEEGWYNVTLTASGYDDLTMPVLYEGNRITLDFSAYQHLTPPEPEPGGDGESD